MPDATITSTASTFGTISGTFAADQSTVTGTVSGIVAGTLTGSVGVPGPAGPAGSPGAGVPTGGTAGQFLTKIDSTNYNTDWTTVNLSAYAPLASPAFTGNPTAPTPAFGDNDTSISTTAFVQSALLGGTAVARNLEVEVRNQSGSTIPAGSIVYISGATGNKPLITLAQANNDANSAQTIGFVKTTIANNGTGYVIVRGVLDNIDTSALTEGVQLYLSPSTAGTWTTTKPYAPQHLVYVGVVIRSHPTLGTILVSVQNGYELDELHNVAAQTPSNNDLLAYETATSLWKNKTFSALGLLTSADAATTYAPIASPTFTGTVTIPAGASISGYLTTSTAASTYAPLASPTFTGTVTIPAGASISGYLTTASAASTYQTISGMSSYLTTSDAASTYLTQSNAASTYQTISGMSSYLTTATAASTYAALAGATFTGKVNTPAATTGGAGFSIAQGVAPTSPSNGDIWLTTTNVVARINGTTHTLPSLSSNNTFTGTASFSNASVNVGTSTATAGYSLGNGATISGSTKTVQIGTGGVAGSTTNISIGSTTGTSTTTLQGTTNGVTAAADTNSVALATTAYVVGQAGSATPLMDNGTAVVGTSLRYARQDHVHPTDTSRAALASPTFTGTPAAPTAAADTNTTQLATTAFVVGQASSTSPVMDGTAAVGTSLKYARADHVHASDTSKANLDSPTFTGTPSLPTGTTAVTQTAGNNTTAVATTAFVTAAVPAFATVAQVVAANSTTTALAPVNQGFLLTNPRLQSLGFINSTSVSGSGGSGGTGSPGSFSRQIFLGSLAVGRAAYLFGTIGTANAGFGTSTAKADQVDFSKKVWIGGYAMMGYSGSPDYRGDANTMCRISLGGYSTNTTGNMTLKGIGLKKVGGVASFVTLTVHNGTTLTDVASTVAIADGAGIQWQIYSDGTGNVTLYINGTQAATTTAGPTTATASGSGCYREQVEAVATPAVRGLMNCNGGWFYTE